jgi:LPXTG-motif cell wall-anchored protein
MKNGILYIVGAVVLLGGGAFLFLKNKKNKDTSKLADLEELTVVEQVKAKEEVKKVEDVKNLVEATDLAKQIDALNKKIDSWTSQKNNPVQHYGFGQNAFSRNAMYQQQINNENKKRVPLIEKLKDLGYTESYGLPVKIR